MAAPLYSRYVPPRAPKPVQAAPVVDRENFDRATPKVVEQDVTSKKRKRSKLEKQEKSQPAQEQGENITPVHDQERRVDDAIVDAPQEKKAKKLKKKTVQKEPQETEAEEQARLKKHSAVLSKFQKAPQRTEAERIEEESAKSEALRLANTSIAPKQGLEPIPQPESDPALDAKPTFSALPPWLAKPVIVKSDFTQAFDELSISSKVLDNLKKQNLSQSFAVQAALLPLLLPGPDSYTGDLLVSAPTGSGKTLAYVLPVIEHLKRKLTRRLRGIVIVPTRELVAQAKETADAYASGTGLHIATAVGNIPLATEQAALIERYQKYDEDGARLLENKAKDMLKGDQIDDDETLEDYRTSIPKHVPAFRSKVDLLICTPGRLVEHLESTRGFNLNDLEWLVIDEADRLLDEGFSEWVPTVMTAIDERPPSLRQKALASMILKPEPDRVRKTILSATMTRDLNKLTALRLYRPTLVAISDQAGNIIEGAQESAKAMELIDLPSTLSEFAIPVGDGAEKPLYLLQLLQTRIFPNMESSRGGSKASLAASNDSDDSDSSISSDSDSSSDSSSESESDSNDSESSISDSPAEKQIDTSIDRKAPLKLSGDNADTTISANVLIFTSNNENATRLAHLLRKLNPTYSSLIETMTKSSASSESRKILRQFRHGRLRVLIASDRASRGLDVPALSYVINYDIPRTLEAYVHRVGRTARAGRAGTAWTLFTDNEGRWFWNEIARASSVRRGQQKVERLKLDARNFDPTWKDAYREALESLKEAVQQKPGK